MSLSISAAKEAAKKYEGIDIHGSKIRISFKFEGKRQFEVLKSTPLTKANIKAASEKRSRITFEIDKGEFDYPKEFPNSRKAKEISLTKQKETGILLDVYLDKVMRSSKFKQRLKTHKTYASRVENYIRPKFGKRHMDTIMPSEIEEWIQQELCHLKNKTIGDILTPLRAAFNMAYLDRKVVSNPLDDVKNPKKESCYQPDPFSPEEISRLKNTCTDRPIELLTALFAMYTGLRPSELLAIAYEDINFNDWSVRVERGVVQGRFSYTKNKASERTVHLYRTSTILTGLASINLTGCR